MTNLTTKFRNHEEELLGAIEGKCDLRSNRKLYKKLHKFYKSAGVIFTGDTETDYVLVVSYLTEDIFTQN